MEGVHNMPVIVIIIMAHHLNYGDEKCKAPGVSSSLSYDATAAFAFGNFMFMFMWKK